jgi:membrane protease YdiL (CAAX protease family)
MQRFLQAQGGFLYLCCSFLSCFVLVPWLVGQLLSSLGAYWPALGKANWLSFTQQASIPLAWLLCFAGLKLQKGSVAFQAFLGLNWPASHKQCLLQTLHLMGLQTLMVLALLALLALGEWETFANPLKPFSGTLYWGFALLVVIVSPLMEELIFRGWLQGHLQERFSPTVSILLTSVLFTCLHVGYRDNGLALAYVFGLGLLYGLWRWHYGSLWPCVLAHGLNNALALLLTTFLRYG